MNADFTLKTYGYLGVLKRQSFSFQTVEEFMSGALGKLVVLGLLTDALALILAEILSD